MTTTRTQLSAKNNVQQPVPQAILSTERSARTSGN